MSPSFPASRAAILVAALDRLRANDWQGAHVLVQDLEDPVGFRIHGLVHRLEGDLSNSRYWYGRANAVLDMHCSVADEIGAIAAQLARPCA